MDGRGALQYLPSRAFGAAGDNKLNSDSGLILHYDINEQAEQWQWFGDSTLWHQRTSWTVTVVWGFYIMTSTNKLNSDSGLGILHYDINKQAEQWQWFGDSTLWHQRTSWTVTVVWFYIMTSTNKLNSDSEMAKVILHKEIKNISIEINNHNSLTCQNGDSDVLWISFGHFQSGHDVL